MFPENENQGDTGPIEAEVKWYNSRKGFGFVLGPDGEDVFFHASALTEAGIAIPYPQRDLHLRSVDPDILSQLQRSSP